MKSNGGVLSADEVVHQPITTVLSGPAAGALGAALIARRAGFDRVLTCDGGGTSTDVSVVLDGEPTLTTEGTVGAYPSKIPMIDVVTVGRRRWLDRVGHARGHAQGGAAVGRRRPRPALLRQGRHRADHHRRPPGARPDPPAPARRRDPARRRGGARTASGLWRPGWGWTSQRCATGILEISAWNQANALRQVSVKRGLDVRDFMLTTFGGSGSLLACRLVDILDLAGVVVPQNPGNVSAFGLLTVDVKNDYVQTHVARHAALDHAAVETGLRRAHRPGHRGARHRGVPARAARLRAHRRPALLRPGLRGAGAGRPRARSTRRRRPRSPTRFHDEHRQLYGYDFRDDPRQQVEWVNLRVTGVGPITRPELRELALPRASASRWRATLDARRSASTRMPATSRPTSTGAPTCGPATPSPGPAIVEEFGSTVPVHPGFAVRVDAFGNLVVTKEAAMRMNSAAPPACPRHTSTATG